MVLTILVSIVFFSESQWENISQVFAVAEKAIL